MQIFTIVGTFIVGEVGKPASVLQFCEGRELTRENLIETLKHLTKSIEALANAD